MRSQEITAYYCSQEDLLKAGCLDMNWAVSIAENALISYRDKRVLFPDKIVQIFNPQTQERINCLPATLLDKKVCGVKWVSVFPMNPQLHGVQNLFAVFVLSQITTGFPIALMEGTLCSNMRVGAMGALAAKHLALPDSRVIGFIGAGEQAKMHFIAMKSQFPSIQDCKVSAKTNEEEVAFIDELLPIFPDVSFHTANTDAAYAMKDADILVTATSAQAPLLKADWVKPGAFYSHIGGWEDEYQVAKICDKIVCDDWETVKHRTQTLSRMYKDGELADDDIHANLVEIVAGDKPGRESPDERIYFNAVGLAYVDVALAYAMYNRTRQACLGQSLKLQECMIFQHPQIGKWIQL